MHVCVCVWETPETETAVKVQNTDLYCINSQSLFCWKIHQHSRRNILAESIRFCVKCAAALQKSWCHSSVNTSLIHLQVLTPGFSTLTCIQSTFSPNWSCSWIRDFHLPTITVSCGAPVWPHEVQELFSVSWKSLVTAAYHTQRD